MTSQDPRLIDVVLPIVEVEGTPPELAYKRLMGSGFLVGRPSHLITAAHVFDGCQPGHAVALAVIDEAFITVGLSNIRTHPTEDAALCDINFDKLSASWLKPSSRAQHQSLDVHVWGYPEDVLWDSETTDDRGRVLQRPELVFTKGYIRRRRTGSVRPFKGGAFFELNDSAGAGCSGGPVIAIGQGHGREWPVCGIYMGEMSTEQNGKPVRHRGYAVRMEAIADWLMQNGCEIQA